MVENDIQSKSGITLNVDVSVKIRKNIMCAKKDYIWNPAACSNENSKYLRSICDDSVVMRDDTIDTTKTVPTNFNIKR